MNKRGLGVIVGTVLIVLITLIAVGVFWGIYTKFSETNSEDILDCTTADLQVLKCSFFHESYDFGGTGNAIGENIIYANIERKVGKGDITGARMIALHDDGSSQILETKDYQGQEYRNEFDVKNDFSRFVEFTKIDILNAGDIQIQFNVEEIMGNLPISLSVQAIVGNSGTICQPNHEPISCDCYSSYFPSPIDCGELVSQLTASGI
ncbi:MAG: hypothetical protein Q8P57_03760 [Candidatus Pacearchaeota archaeon]|nr:hypothetical protein [Candidatus Pacearchaeota archaeon]